MSSPVEIVHAPTLFLRIFCLCIAPGEHIRSDTNRWINRLKEMIWYRSKERTKIINLALAFYFSPTPCRFPAKNLGSPWIWMTWNHHTFTLVVYNQCLLIENRHTLGRKRPETNLWIGSTLNLFIQTGENLELNNQYRMVDGGQNVVILPLVSQICSGKPILAL